MRNRQNSGRFSKLSAPHLVPPTRLVWLACTLAAVGAAQAQTATETVIHTFGNFPQGANPYATPFRAADGILYGTTYQGGAANLGVLFELGASGYKALYSFRGGTDGANPYAGVTQDSAGNLYGTTYQGGAANAGVVYKVNPSGQETLLYTFTGAADGGNPYGGVIVDSAGNLYGTACNGGGAANAGVVFEVNPSGQETVLYSFKGKDDGANPRAGVIADTAGNLYGTTYAGGKLGAGVVYKLDTAGQESVLHAFSPPNGGAAPTAGVIRDSAGNFYGTASDIVYELAANGQYTVLARLGCFKTGGNASAGVVQDASGNLYGTSDPAPPACTGGGGPPSNGVVYKVDTSGQMTVLYRFPGASRPEPDLSSGPNAGVVLDSAGNLYGATLYGGLAGMVYKVNTAGQETGLYSFPAAPGGTQPAAALFRSAAGSLYGTTHGGGVANEGVVYMFDAADKETALYGFTGGADGANPNAGVVVDSAGNVYGTTYSGGTADAGLVFKVDTSGHETALYTFTGGADGGSPNGVIMDAAGNLYGTTFGGGAASQTGAQEGVVFKVDLTGQETVLYSFTGLSDGGAPTAGLVRDPAGNLYGTTGSGGLGAGVIFKVDPSGRETVLYAFAGGADGGTPFAGLTQDPAGNLYGTAANYGSGGGGVVFELNAAGNYSVLYSFAADGPDGSEPSTSVVRDQAGNLYGTTGFGGTLGSPACNLGCGVAYELAPSGALTVLRSFTGGADGGGGGALALDPAGNIYGTGGFGVTGGGVLYKLTPQR